MKKRVTLLILVQIVLLFNQLSAQNGNYSDPLIPNQQNRSVLFGNDVILNDQQLQNQRNAVVRSAFNGWLYAGYAYINSQYQWPAAIILKSEDNGISWTVLFDMLQPFDNCEMKSLDMVVTGDSVSNLKIFLAFMIVLKNTTLGTGEGYVLRFNAVTGVYENMLSGISGVSDVAFACDAMYPATNSNPFSIGSIYSYHSININKDSILIFTSDNGGMSFTNLRHIAVTSNRFMKVAFAYGRSLSKNSGRYFGAWEEKLGPSSNLGHIYTSHSNPDFNSDFTVPLLVDSLIMGAMNNVRNPAIACQFSNYDNDSSDFTEIILFDTYTGGSNYDVQGVYNIKAASGNHFIPFSLGSALDDIIQPTISFNPYDSTFMVSYFNMTYLSLPFLRKDCNMQDPLTWQILTTKINDSTNLSNPTPSVSLNIGQKQGMVAWSAEGPTGNGIALFDAPYLITGLSGQDISTINPGFFAWPNPCNNILNMAFKLQGSTYLTITLYDLTGKPIVTCGNQTFSEGKHCLKLDISSYSCGTYFLEFRTNKTFVSSKVIIIR